MRLTDLPVAVQLPGPLADEVCAWVETEAGWQVVAPEGPPTPVVVLTDRPLPERPCVVIVDGSCDAGVLRTALLAGALDVVGWPEERARLLDAPLRVRQPVPARAGARLLRVAGLGGGAGASTVALALGGLLAWSGRPCLVVGGEDLLRLAGIAWSGPGGGELARLDAASAAAEAAALARPLPSVPGLSVLGGGAVTSVQDWPWPVVIVDQRTAPEQPGLLVARPDSCLAGATAWPGVPVLVVGRGPLDAAGVRRVLGHPPAGWLPASARVARAGCVARVPAGLPGSWLAQLRSLLPVVAR